MLALGNEILKCCFDLSSRFILTLLIREDLMISSSHNPTCMEKVEGTGLVQLREEKAAGRPHCGLPVLEGSILTGGEMTVYEGG